MSKDRILRGGSYNDNTRILRTTKRDWIEPEDRYWCNGFRIVVKRRKKP